MQTNRTQHRHKCQTPTHTADMDPSKQGHWSSVQWHTEWLDEHYIDETADSTTVWKVAESPPITKNPELEVTSAVPTLKRSVWDTNSCHQKWQTGNVLSSLPMERKRATRQIERIHIDLSCLMTGRRDIVSSHGGNKPVIWNQWGNNVRIRIPSETLVSEKERPKRIHTYATMMHQWPIFCSIS